MHPLKSFATCRVYVAAIVAASIAFDADAQGLGAPAARVHSEWLRAYNIGTREAISGFVRSHSITSDTARHREATDYWLALRAEVGALDLVGDVHEDRGSRTAHIFWYRGRVTGAYPGIEFRLDSSTNRIRGYGINRAGRPSVAPALIQPDEARIPQSLAAFFRTAADSGHFSGAVAVLKDGKTIFENAYGFADLAARRQNTVDTPYMLASVTKMFSGAAILQLIEDGLLSLDEPIARRIPEYPAAIGQRVTVRHLLTHTSGIELDGDSTYMAEVVRARSVSDLLRVQVSRLPNVYPNGYESFRPLDHFDYTNEGIDLLGVLIERASGRTWQDYLADRVFRPAGMQRARADLLAMPADLAKGYTVRTADNQRLSVRVPATPTSMGAVRPAGTGVGTLRDLAAFMSALQSGVLLRPESLRAMMTAQVAVPTPGGSMPCQRQYGLTMNVTTCKSGSVSVGHSGQTFGASTYVSYYPAEGYTVVILSNFDRVSWWVSTSVQELLGIAD